MLTVPLAHVNNITIPRAFVKFCIIAYFDESGTHGGSSNAVVGGYLSTVQKWKKLRKAWQSILDRENVQAFHRVDMESFQGEFEGWGRERQVAVILECQDLIKRHTEKGLGAAVVIRDFERVMPAALKRVLGGPYGWAIHDCMIGIGRWADSSGQKGMVQYVFETGAHGRRQVERMISVLCSHPPAARLSKYDWQKTLRIAGSSFQCKKYVTQLQAADWFAYEVYKHMDNRVVEGPKRPVRRSARHLFRPSIDEVHYWDGDRLRAWIARNIATVEQLKERERNLRSIGRKDLI